MALKKSELYSSLWSSYDELRGGMDASQYKDYVLVMLFVKYVSDKYADIPYAPITIPEGASFKDMVALKGKSDIGDEINKGIIEPLANANKLSDMPDFNDRSRTALDHTGGVRSPRMAFCTSRSRYGRGRWLAFSDCRPISSNCALRKLSSVWDLASAIFSATTFSALM